MSQQEADSVGFAVYVALVSFSFLGLAGTHGVDAVWAWQEV